MKGYIVRKIGSNRGAPRIWLEDSIPAKGGFLPGSRYELTVGRKSVILTLRENGERVVSRKTVGDAGIPVIDINSREILGVFEGMKAVRVSVRDGEIRILPIRSEELREERVERARRKLASGEPFLVGSLASGGGIMAAAIKEGLAKSGVATRLAFANDIDETMAEAAGKANPAWDEGTVAITSPMQEAAFDPECEFPKVEILEVSNPCSGASVAGMSKRGLSVPEAHPEVGHLIAATVAIIARTNPCYVVFENVVPYRDSASGHILRSSLRDLGYRVEETTLNGLDYGALENRTRWVLLAVSEGLPGDLSDLPAGTAAGRTLSEVLESVPEDDPAWREMRYLIEKQERDAAAGKGFRMNTVTPESKSVGTIGRGYRKNRSTEAKVEHPTLPGLFRLFTPEEHGRIKGFPEGLIEAFRKVLSDTPFDEMAGQSVVYPVFVAVGETVGRWIAKAAEGAVPFEAREFGVCG